MADVTCKGYILEIRYSQELAKRGWSHYHSFFSSAKTQEKHAFVKCYTILSPGQMDSQVDSSLIGLALNLRFVWPPTCDDLHGLALTSVELKSGRKFFTVLTPSASRHKLIASDLLLWKRVNQWYAWNLQLFATCEPTCESVWPPITSPHASSAFANLHRDLRVCLARALHTRL